MASVHANSDLSGCKCKRRQWEKGRATNLSSVSAVILELFKNRMLEG